jgi:hypothetical protein
MSTIYGPQNIDIYTRSGPQNIYIHSRSGPQNTATLDAFLLHQYRLCRSRPQARFSALSLVYGTWLPRALDIGHGQLSALDIDMNNVLQNISTYPTVDHGRTCPPAVGRSGPRKMTTCSTVDQDRGTWLTALDQDQGAWLMAIDQDQGT